MHCLVTAGPTWEPLDDVRRMTNFSTGKLGTELAEDLAAHGHVVTLLQGELATYHGPCRAQKLERFSTTDDLRGRLERHVGSDVGAVFHTAAVSDFGFGRVWQRRGEELAPVPPQGKLSSREEPWLVELVPTRKLIRQLRSWFPAAVLVGWKYEVDGGRNSALDLARRQMSECRLNGSVANGAAYGEGFGLVTASLPHHHCPDAATLYEALRGLLETRG